MGEMKEIICVSLDETYNNMILKNGYATRSLMPWIYYKSYTESEINKREFDRKQFFRFLK